MPNYLGDGDVTEVYRIGELAARLGMPAATLRSWERRHDLLPSLRSPGGQRLYTSQDLERIQQVRRFVEQGWTVGGAVAATRPMPADGSDTSSPNRSGHPIADLARHMLDAVDQAVIATDANGVIIFWNAAAERLYGWPAEEVLGRPILDVLSGPEDLAEAAAIIEALQKGRTWTGRFPVRRRDGSTITTTVRDAPVRSPTGAIEAIIGVSFDDSEHRKAIDTMRQRAAEIEAIAVLGAQARRGDTDTLLADAVETVRQFLDVSHVALISTRADEFRVVAAFPGPPAATSTPSRRTLAGFTARAGRVVFANSLHTERRFTAGSLIEAQGAVSAVAAPIIDTWGTKGVLVATSTEPRDFSAYDGHFLQAVANIVAGIEQMALTPSPSTRHRTSSR